ncbi:MAG: sialidase family protein [Candidatus Glassbacteria bacterium]
MAREVVQEIVVAAEEDTLNQDEPYIMVHPDTDTLLMAVWNAETLEDWEEEAMDVGYGFSMDGGLTWDSTGVIPEVGEFEGTILMNAADPSCGFGSGYAYCTRASYRPEDPSIAVIYFARTSNFGQSWDQFYVSDDSLTEYRCDGPFMYVDNTSGDYNERIYVTWGEVWGQGNPPGTTDSSAIRFAYSTSSDQSWSNPKNIAVAYQLEGEDPIHEAVFSGRPTVGIDGTLYITWMYEPPRENFEPGELSKDSCEIKVARSTDGGENFIDCSPNSIFSKITDWQTYRKVRLSSYPVIVFGALDTNVVYVAYMAKTSSDDANIYFIRSTNKGESWSDPEI